MDKKILLLDDHPGISALQEEGYENVARESPDKAFVLFLPYGPHDIIVQLYPEPRNAPDVSPGMNVPSFPKGKGPKTTDSSPWYGVCHSGNRDLAKLQECRALTEGGQVYSYHVDSWK